MFVDVTFFEETPFFSSSQQDINSTQQVLPISTFSPMISPVYENSNQEENQSHPPTNSPVMLSSPPPMISQHKTQGTSPTLQESSGLCPSPLASLMTDPSCSSSAPHDDDSRWPIVLRKGIQSTWNPHPIYQSYYCLASSHFSFVSSLSSLAIPKNVHEALDHPRWRHAMIVELEHNGT